MSLTPKPLSGLAAAVFLLPLMSMECQDFDTQLANRPFVELPPLTQSGRGTFGCFVNDEPFWGDAGADVFVEAYATLDTRLRNGVRVADIDIDMSYINDDGLFRRTDRWISFSLSLPEASLDHVVGDYSVSSPDDFVTADQTWGVWAFGFGCDVQGSTSSGIEGSLTIVQFKRGGSGPGVISGTFEFLTQEDCGQVAISQGRFDLRLVE